MRAMHVAGAAAQDAMPKVSGEIRKVDVDAGKITIRHGEIPNLDMPAMTMVFRAASPDMLNQVKTGDQVLFTAKKNNGALTVTTIEVLPPK
nr:copper-binding protein [Herbaspirillum sp. RV1423]